MPELRSTIKNRPYSPSSRFYLATCFGSVFARMDEYDMETVYHPRVKGKRKSSHTSTEAAGSNKAYLFDKEIAHHVSLLRAAGFTFSHTLGANPGYDPDPDKVVHTFGVKADDNNPFMAKLLLNAIRWVAQWHKCARAFSVICADIKPTTQLEYLNAMLVASYAQCPGNGHNIAPYSALILPLTDEQLAGIKKLTAHTAMDGNLPSLWISRVTPNMNFSYLLSPGGYAEYQRVVASEIARIDAERAEQRTQIRGVLQWAAV